MKDNPRVVGLRRRVWAAINAWHMEMQHRNRPAFELLQRKDLHALNLTLVAELSAGTPAAPGEREPNEAGCDSGETGATGNLNRLLDAADRVVKDWEISNLQFAVQDLDRSLALFGLGTRQRQASDPPAR